MKSITIHFILLIMLISGNSLAQKNWTIHFGIKSIEYRGDNIQFYYRDESPDPDDFYTDIKLEGTTIYNIGGSFNNYSKAKKAFWDITGNIYFGNYFGVDLGASIGYPVFLNESQKISLLPKLTAGGGWYDKKLGILENNTIYIQVNDTRFQNYENVELSLSGFYFFLKPGLEFLFDITQRAQIVLSCGYLLNIDLNPKIDFEGPDQNGDNTIASEKLTESNIAFYIDYERKNESPFKLMGLEATIGLNFRIGN